MRNLNTRLRWMVLGGLCVLLAACATSGTKVACDGKLQPINAPASAAVAKTADHPVQERAP